MRPSGKRVKGRSLPIGRSFRRPALIPALLAIGLVCLTGSTLDPASAQGSGPGILIRFDTDADREERSRALKAVDGEVARRFSLVPGLRLVQLDGGVSQGGAIESLDGMPGVDFVARDSMMDIDRSANDPQLNQLWGLTAIRAPSAWDVTTGSAGVAVAVIDTGMDLDHPDLAGNLWTNPDEIGGNGVDDDGNGFVDDVHGWDFVNRDAVPDDDQGHGTHTAGTVGAVGDNGIGVAGVAWDVSLIPLKICSATGRCLVSDAIAAFEYAVREGIPISNNSYGYGGSCPTAFGAAIEAAGDAGHLVVASAGNEGRDLGDSPKYPATCPQENLISVAWLANETTLASKSNYGVQEVDLAAPGGQILSTTPGGTYGSKSGTSMAAPHVAGTAALLKSAQPPWGWQEIKGRIMASTRKACGLPVASEGTLDAGLALSGGVDPEPDCPDPPELISGPSSPTNSTEATFEFRGAAGASFQCKLDLAPWQACQSPVTFFGVGNGGHTFLVSQAIGSGPSSSASIWTWSVDTFPPSTPSVSAAPTSPTDQRSATFTFTGESGATFLCRLDEGPLAACSSPLSLSGLPEGQRSLTVFQTDRAGNRSQGTIRSWTIADPTPEPPSITAAPAELTSSRSASITFSTTAGTTARCRLDRNEVTGQWADCSSPLSLTGLDDGTYRVAILLRNSTGDESDPSEVTWTVDGTAPSPPRVESMPDSFTGSSVEISFSGEPGASFECRFDTPEIDSESSPCSSPFTRLGLEQGLHSLVIQQRDGAGNLSDPVEVEWVVDTLAPPAPSITDGPEPITNSRTASFTFSTESGANASCRLDDGPWESCEGSFEAEELQEGSHLLRLRQADRAGNESPETTRIWQVDTTAPPAPSITGGPVGLTRLNSARFSFTGEDGARAECRSGEDAWDECPQPTLFGPLSDGPMSASFRQVDRAGNVSPVVERSWTVDATAPKVSAAKRSKDRRGRAVLAIRAVDAVSGLAGLEISFSSLEPSSRPDRRIGWPSGGKVTVASTIVPFWIRVVDRAGNRSGWVRLKTR